MGLLLGVNIDHIATLRQVRYAGAIDAPNAEPSPLAAAKLALQGGADSITIHVRQDRRHMQDSDAFAIRKEIAAPLNLEMCAAEEMLAVALKVRPDFVCIVPEKRQELTTEGGLDLEGNLEKIGKLTKTLQRAGIKVSLFIDPDCEQVRLAAEIAADMIELHTGCFANAAAQQLELRRLIDSAIAAHRYGLQVNAGHGINYSNITKLLETPYLAELNIGHSIIAQAIESGLVAAVAGMKQLMSSYSNKHGN